jgi:hypothetical protein
MSLARSAAEVLKDHVVFELEGIDRMYLNLYRADLQRDLGWWGSFARTVVTRSRRAR